MQSFSMSGVRDARDTVYALKELGVPYLLVDHIEEMIDESARLERVLEDKNNSDFRAYEEANEGYMYAMNDILEVLETFRGRKRLNSDKVLDAFNEIKKIISNVH